ncbi:MAG: hypothetical protein K2Q18_02390 [Bdellovibrionales bacterium]|nr:hypothetical protein [Bdellovibrionales bacterium]
MEAFALKIFIIWFHFIGMQVVPNDFARDWEITKKWDSVGSQYIFEANSSTLVSHCQKNENDNLVFPQIIHSSQTLEVDGVRVAILGQADHSASSPFYQQMLVSCSQIKHGNNIKWTVLSYSYYFSRINQSPYFEKNIWGINFLNVTTNFLAFGILIILSLFTLIIFKNRVSDELTYSVCIGSFFLAIYFANTANFLFGLHITMLSSHKMGDIALWIGVYFFYRAFEADKFSPRVSSIAIRVAIILGIFVIFIGGNGDVVQLGTTIPMLPVSVALGTVVVNIYNKMQNKKYKRHLIIKIISVLSFLLFGLNDIFHINGLINTGMTLSYGVVGCIFGLAISVAQGIDIIYRQRDEMRVELEAWAPPFILRALKYEKIKFPIRKDLAAITYDIIASSKYHGVFIDGRPIRAVILQGFSEIILRLGGWRESHAGDSAYAHFGILPNQVSSNHLAYQAALEFKKFLDDLNELHKTNISCGIGLHLASNALINVHTVAQKINDEVIQQKSFDTTSTDVDLVHRIESLTHTLPGSNIAMSEAFVKSLNLTLEETHYLGVFKLKGQERDIGVYVVKDERVTMEHLNVFRKLHFGDAVGF